MKQALPDEADLRVWKFIKRAAIGGRDMEDVAHGLGLSTIEAWEIFWRCNRRIKGIPHWTDGLSTRLANRLCEHWVSRDQISDAVKIGTIHPLRLYKHGPVYHDELLAWLKNPVEIQA